jgi:hypothetical protein
MTGYPIVATAKKIATIDCNRLSNLILAAASIWLRKLSLLLVLETQHESFDIRAWQVRNYSYPV